MKRTILITGATSGFGKAIALKFAQSVDKLVITGRRLDRLVELKKEIESDHSCKVVVSCFDVRDRSEVEAAVKALPSSHAQIDVLVNNAGLASGLDKLQDGHIDNWDTMIDTNVKGLLYVSKAIIPSMVERKAGHIINIGSTAGKEVYEKGNVYCATKHAVDAISKAMRIDLLEAGIKVTQISPGAAETEFSEVRFHGDKERAKNAYQGYKPMSADDIAMLADFAIHLPPHLCINDMVVTSLAQANSFYIHRN